MTNRLSGAACLAVASLLIGGCAAPWLVPEYQRRMSEDARYEREARRMHERQAALKPAPREDDESAPREDDEPAPREKTETAPRKAEVAEATDGPADEPEEIQKAVERLANLIDRHGRLKNAAAAEQATAAPRQPTTQKAADLPTAVSHPAVPTTAPMVVLPNQQQVNQPPPAAVDANPLRRGDSALPANGRLPTSFTDQPLRGQLDGSGDPSDESQATQKPNVPPPYNPNLPTDSRDQAASPRDVEQASHQADDIRPKSFQEELAEAIDALEEELKDKKLDKPEQVRREVLLRLLFLASADDDVSQRAIEHIAQLDESERDYWASQFFTLRKLLDFERYTAKDHRASAALADLRRAVASLAQISSLAVRNVKLCTEVRDYGVYEEFPEMQFVPGQRAILYAEIDNFSSQQQGGQFETSLLGEYEIWSLDNRKVAMHKFNLETDLCRSRRRDFFLPYPIQFPDNIPPGNYRLLLTIRDTKADKINQASVEFSISP